MPQRVKHMKVNSRDYDKLPCMTSSLSEVLAPRWAPGGCLQPLSRPAVVMTHLSDGGCFYKTLTEPTCFGLQRADIIPIYSLILENLTSKLASHGTITGKNQGIPHVSFPPKHFV